MRTRQFVAVPALFSIAVAVGVTGCSSNSSDSSARSTPSSSASSDSMSKPSASDIAFVRTSLTRQQQSTQMAHMAKTAGGSAQVRSLAASILADNDHHLGSARSWMKSNDVNSTQMHSMMSGSPNSDGMPGLASSKSMKRLSMMRGTAFDQKFLTMMTTHYRGTMTEAQQEMDHGSGRTMRSMAEAMRESSSHELRRMHRMQRAED